MEVSTKWCRKCLKDLPIQEFHKDAWCPDGHKYACRTCENLARRSRNKFAPPSGEPVFRPGRCKGCFQEAPVTRGGRCATCRREHKKIYYTYYKLRLVKSTEPRSCGHCRM